MGIRIIVVACVVVATASLARDELRSIRAADGTVERAAGVAALMVCAVIALAAIGAIVG